MASARLSLPPSLASPLPSATIDEVDEEALSTMTKQLDFVGRTPSPSDSCARQTQIYKQALLWLTMLVQESLPGFELLEYGARKKGTDTEWSDIDVVVVGSSEERETLQRFRNLVFNKEAELLQQLGIRQVIINDEKLTARVPTLKFSLTTNLHAALHVCVLPALAASIDLRSFHIEVLVLCFLLDSRVWPRKAYSGENARAQLLLDLVEFYATRFRPREHYIHHERGTTKMYFVQRQEGRMGDLVMSSLLPASDAEGDAFYDSPRDGGWEQVIKPFFQTISDGIRNQSWSPELEELLGVGRPTRSERISNLETRKEFYNKAPSHNTGHGTGAHWH
ncbi:hypothetical protein EMIHUDRAFT_220361 [Emiliania huxleyi CCMP1516]|uniref:Polymerase nucleotidyl transferase domain-containing protein n=2 Tax=Emiliania huxleyi TaxID=2903 RepID=A0A0D3I1T0_EMIH1|nr:hypothetical protein EMIHUDRAFT_220361 [Emiliania huxleyi CCMP1516]EOD05215.1 hypothetical protein EMIHUDRAFT_220361 [Emiliania huxleyi CCMP1516]|eukprot:XP_005757644.1 hypothetical protein EMIHUDRAFT_220361 [Emiliania huxleyi CCMP1516]